MIMKVRLSHAGPGAQSARSVAGVLRSPQSATHRDVGNTRSCREHDGCSPQPEARGEDCHRDPPIARCWQGCRNCIQLSDVVLDRSRRTSMAKKLKLPKRIAGMKIPKTIRKGPVGEFMS